MSFIPSVYQQAIKNWFDNATGNAAVDAVAGSGKSSTIAWLLSLLPFALQRNSLITAFGVDIVKALGDKVPEAVNKKGINALGYAAIRNAFRDRKLDQWKVQAWKYKEMAKGLSVPSEYGDKSAFIASVVSLLGFVQKTLTRIDDLETIESLVYRFNLQIPPCGVTPLVEAVSLLLNRGIDQIKEDGIISFDDQIWYPNYADLDCDQYELICVDEAQDLSKAQMGIVERSLAKDGRLIAVGDPCQPTGTKILKIIQTGDRWNPVAQTEEVNIEDLREGDSVAVANLGDSAFYSNGIVQGITKRSYCGDLIVATLPDGKRSKYTVNHHCLVNFDRYRGYFALYLMCRGDQFRIGMSQFYEDSTNPGPLGRMRCEKADSLWVLAFYETKEEAYIMEQAISGKFGIPQLVFNQAKLNTPDLCAKAWSIIGNNYHRGVNCLEYFHRDVRYPLFTKDRNGQQSLKRPFVTEASNLMENVLMLPYLGSAHFKKDQWQPAQITREYYDGDVYSLTVDPTHLYVADGIATHNCQAIYMFNGAECDSFDQLANQFQMHRLPLSICYRCPSAVVKEAQRLVPQIEAREGAEEGIVDEIRGAQFRKMLNAGDMILSRTTAPLVKLCFDLISQRKGATIKGRDISAGLTSLVEQISKKTSWKDFDLGLDNYQGHQVELLSRKPGTESAIEALQDKCEAIRVCYQSFQPRSSMGFIKDIESLFSDVNGNRNNLIVLSTVHRSKGLENPRIFNIYPEKLPLVWKNQSEAQYRQEQNLEYVAITRAQRELYFVETEKEGSL